MAGQRGYLIEHSQLGLTLRQRDRLAWGLTIGIWAKLIFPVAAQIPVSQPSTPSTPAAEALELDPSILEESPVLREWLEQIPDIADEILHEPSFPTRLRLGYSQFPSNGQIGGVLLGVEDVFIAPGTGLTVSGDYTRSWNGDRQAFGAEARYYLFPLGSYINLAPIVGYRNLETPSYMTDGLNLGFKLVIAPSRGGGADISVSQSFVAPGSVDEVGLTGITVGYGVTKHLRLATDIQFQNSRFGQDSRLGVIVEWMPR